MNKPTRLPRAVSERLYALVWTIIVMASLMGCGGGKTTRTAPPPSPASYDQFRPNFLGDLAQANYWPQDEATYRFVELGQAKNLSGNTITNEKITASQRDATVRAFQQWQDGSNVPGPGETTHNARIRFREAGDGESADIKIVVQNRDAFSGNLLGVTSWWLKADQQLGAALVRVRADLRGEQFQAVVLHELGHAWGCDGHDRQWGQVMYATIRPLDPVTSLSERDRNSISANYARDVSRAAGSRASSPGTIYSILCNGNDMSI